MEKNNLEDLFDKLYEGSAPPPELKREVMASVRLSQLAMDIGGLFTVVPIQMTSGAGDAGNSPNEE